jgi:tetratricopeptide (TPR) repeat protein
MLQSLKKLLLLSSLVLLGCETKETQLQRFLLQGNEALAEQNYQGAEYYFQEAMKLDPCFVDALNNLGVLYSNQNRFDVAIEYFTKTLACDDTFIVAYFNRANSFYESKGYYSLLKDAEHILKVRPDTAVGFVLLGLAKTKLRQWDDANTAFTKAISLEPRNAEHYVNRGTIKYYQKKWDDATADFKYALQVLPKQPNAINALGLIYTDKNQLDSAKMFFDLALELVPQEPYFLNNMGFIYLLQNELEKAKEVINLSITLDPDNAWAYRNKGIYYLAMSDYPSAERLLKQSLSMDESVDKIHYYYGVALHRNKKNKEACEQFRESEKAGDGLIKNEIKESCP